MLCLKSNTDVDFENLEHQKKICLRSTCSVCERVIVGTNTAPGF